MKRLLIQVELINSEGTTVVYWIPATGAVRPGLHLRLQESGNEAWTVSQTFTTCLGPPPVPHRLGTLESVPADDTAA
jgi:hypothetical protein